jgi:methylmalonyl-CoA mutase N-terminal domain/subunit
MHFQAGPFYGPDDLDAFDYERDLGDPGQYPFTRGIYPTMYHGRVWTMRQYAGFGMAEESNARYKFLLEQGQSGLSVALDLPTQLGLDSDDPLAEGEVGKVGVAIDTLRDMEILFDGLPIDKVSTSFTINATAAILLAMYIVVAEKQGISSHKLRGTIQNDILKEYVARGTWIFPPEPSIRLIVDTIEYCAQHAPRFYTISISGYHIREAGATAVQELAFTLANALVYVQAVIDRGLDVDDFAPRLSFFFSSHNDFFVEIAKFRAGRRLWARIMKERFGARDPKSWGLRFGIACAGSTLRAEQPRNNVVRVAYEAMSAVLGGAQSVFTCAWDEPFALPSAESAQLALRTQQILAYETGIKDVVDPLAGSYYVESLTNQLEEETGKLMDDIESQGGMVPAIRSGRIQKMILDQAYREQIEIQSGERVIVGFNRFQSGEGKRKLDLARPGSQNLERQVERLHRVKAERDGNSVHTVLSELRQAAQGQENVMPYLIEAVRHYATLGELTALLKEVFGEFREPVNI